MIAPAVADKKVVRAWAMYDWANSVYPLVINSTIFPIYYEALTSKKDVFGNVVNDTVNFCGFELRNVTLLAYALAFSYLVVAILSPILSGIADSGGKKKFFLKCFCYLGSLSCIMLATFNPDNLLLGMFWVVLASIGFSGGLVFYNAFLPEIAPQNQHDHISAKGFSYGYIGSVILLVFNLVMVLFPDFFGFENVGSASKVAFITVGIWWAGFAQFMFAGVPEKRREGGAKLSLTKGYQELISVWQVIKTNVALKRYLSAFFVFNLSVQTVMVMAASFAAKEVKQIGDTGLDEPMDSSKLITSILIIQILAIPGSYFFSWLSSKLGNLKTILTAIIIWILVCIGAYFVTYDKEFFVVAAVVGLIMGGIQSMSRSTYSKLLPDTHDNASFFSFYDVTDKLGMVFGIFSFGLIGDLTGSTRNSIAAIVLFFVIGLILLARVPKVQSLQAKA